MPKYKKDGVTYTASEGSEFEKILVASKWELVDGPAAEEEEEKKGKGGAK